MEPNANSEGLISDPSQENLAKTNPEGSIPKDDATKQKETAAQPLKTISYNTYAKDRGAKPKSGSIPSAQIAPFRVITPNKEEILVCRFDHESQLIALGLTNGFTSINSVASGNLVSYLDCSTSAVPVTAIRWRPNLPGITSKSIAVTGSADGTICHWHVNSGKLLHRTVEENNQILALDYNPDGSSFASAGKDYKVRIYDETTKVVNMVLDRGLWQNPGHSNRVFSLKFVEDEPDLLLSGGWDNNMHIWDLREGKSIACIYGPNISGDSIDCKDGVILTGSCRTKDQLELWDFGTRKLLRVIDWEYGMKIDKLNVYSAQFSKKSTQFVLACGSVVNEARIFDQKGDYMDFAKVSGFSKGLYSVDFAPNQELFAVAGGDGEAHIVKLTK